MPNRAVHFVCRVVGAIVFAGLLGFVGNSGAATIELRPDLAERIIDLQPIYPRHYRLGATGQLPQTVDWDYLANGNPHASTWINEEGEEVSTPVDSVQVILVSGEIQPGDARRLWDLLQPPAPPESEPVYQLNDDGQYVTPYEEGPGTPFIAFDSPGGSFSEGLKIGRYLQTFMSYGNELNVIVLNGHSCKSACAMAFALAVRPAHPSTLDTRFIEMGGVLGFHMPFAEGEQAKAKATVGELYELTADVIKSISSLVRFGANGTDFLAAVVAETDPQQTLDIKGDLEGYRYGFTPVAADLAATPASRQGLDIATLRDVCKTIYLAGPMIKGGQRSEPSSYEHTYPLLDAFKIKPVDLVETDVHGWSDPPHLVVGLGSPGAACHYFPYSANRYAIAVLSVEPRCVDTPGSLPRNGGIGATCLASSITRSSWEDRDTDSGISIDSTMVTKGLVAASLGCRPDGTLERTSEYFPGEIVTKREQQLYSAPSTSGMVTSVLPALTVVQLRGCRMVDDEVGVWLEVTASSGSGWIDARTVEPDDDSVPLGLRTVATEDWVLPLFCELSQYGMCDGNGMPVR